MAKIEQVTRHIYVVQTQLHYSVRKYGTRVHSFNLFKQMHFGTFKPK
uniref:Uncharacterized protein n=1 Tax=Rhizophora mucronata TaxID=61149 RepID=A0A2P2P2Y7_RHIMU